MEQDEVHAVLDALGTAGIPTWVAGGWGVDALAGRQTRAHRDLDLLVDAERLEDCLSILTARGYAVETDWLPVRVEVGAAGAAGSTYTRCGSPPTAAACRPASTGPGSTTRPTASPPATSRVVRCPAWLQDSHDLRVLRTLEPGIDTRRQPPTRDSDRAVIAGADGDLQARFQRIGFAE